jgi:hypothetical protein
MEKQTLTRFQQVIDDYDLQYGQNPEDARSMFEMGIFPTMSYLLGIQKAVQIYSQEKITQPCTKVLIAASLLILNQRTTPDHLFNTLDITPAELINIETDDSYYIPYKNIIKAIQVYRINPIYVFDPALSKHDHFFLQKS